MHEDQSSYYFFTSKSRLDKALNSLLGIIEGVVSDSQIDEKELNFLKIWLDENKGQISHHPFNELIPVVNNALLDGVISSEEKLDIVYLCENLRSIEYYDLITADLQRLHGYISGILSDNIINEKEIFGLSEWINDHVHLKGCWPYDEINTLITHILDDKIIDNNEKIALESFFNEFDIGNDFVKQVHPMPLSIRGIFTIDPKVIIKNHKFCLTGSSPKYNRKQFSELIMKFGGLVQNSVSPLLNYLIIGSGANPCWAYACYGRKVEKAMELRRQGYKINIIQESDFHLTAEKLNEELS